MDTFYRLSPLDILQRPDIQESISVLRLCGFISDSLNLHLEILCSYCKLRQSLPPNTKKIKIYEQIHNEKIYSIDTESIRKIVEHYQSPISNEKFNAFVSKYHFVP